MAVKIWVIEYQIRKVDGNPHAVPAEMHRISEEQVPQLIKESAQRIAERFDFPFVKVTAKATEDGKTYTFTHQADEGYRSEWGHGRQ